jgi:hypothetical protein
MVVRTGAGNGNCPEFAGAGNCPEFAKAVIIIRKSKKDRQHNGLVWFMVFNATINISNISWRLPLPAPVRTTMFGSGYENCPEFAALVSSYSSYADIFISCPQVGTYILVCLK